MKVFLLWMIALSLPFGAYTQNAFIQAPPTTTPVCPNNLIVNGDLAVSNPTNGDQDIDNATGFSRIWATGSFAEIYPANYSPFSLPSPASGTYVSCWIANNNAAGSSSTYREGFKVALTQTILPNTGTYTLTFDMASIGGFGVAELGVYGVSNPTNGYSAQPVSFNVPDNINLFGPTNTVLLDEVLIPTWNATKSLQTIVINTSTSNYPAGGMTHLMFTHSGNPLSGARYTAFDDFCLSDNDTTGTTPNICNSHLTNIDLEQGTPSILDNDIDNAVNYSRIWATGNSAGYYPANYSPYGFQALPSPATGNFAGCWIVNDNTSSTTTERQGFKVELTAPILANTGTYDLNFDMACLKNSGTGEIGIYGIYNPNNAFSVQPTGHSTPSNMNLYGSNNTVLLGTVVVNNFFTNKATYTISFNSNASTFPVNGMTHFFITKSDNQAIRGMHYVAFDDFCLKSTGAVPPVACPEVNILGLECIPDINGDGVPDYKINLNVINSGSIHFTTGCGSIAPASITGAGNHFITIASDGTCFPFQLEYYILNSNQEQCFKDRVEVRLPRCGRVSRTIGQANLFPNPVTDYLQVRWSTEDIPDELSIRVFNVNGVEVQSILAVNGHEGQVKLNTEGLNAGLYFIKIEGENYQVTPMKFIKTTR